MFVHAAAADNYMSRHIASRPEIRPESTRLWFELWIVPGRISESSGLRVWRAAGPRPFLPVSCFQCFYFFFTTLPAFLLVFPVYFPTSPLLPPSHLCLSLLTSLFTCLLFFIVIIVIIFPMFWFPPSLPSFLLHLPIHFPTQSYCFLSHFLPCTSSLPFLPSPSMWFLILFFHASTLPYLPFPSFIPSRALSYLS